MLIAHELSAYNKELGNMAQDQTIFSWHDYDGEPSRTTFNTVEITAANLDAQATAANALRSAINALTLVSVEQAVITDNVWDNIVPVTNPFAQREIKWVVIVRDTAGNTYRSNEFPMANLDLLENNSKYLVKSGNVVVAGAATEVQAFIDAFEAFAVSNTGLALQVWDVYQAGRNN